MSESMAAKAPSPRKLIGLLLGVLAALLLVGGVVYAAFPPRAPGEGASPPAAATAASGIAPAVGR
jgi:hypothetical protein